MPPTDLPIVHIGACWAEDSTLLGTSFWLGGDAALVEFFVPVQISGPDTPFVCTPDVVISLAVAERIAAALAVVKADPRFVEALAVAQKAGGAE